MLNVDQNAEQLLLLWDVMWCRIVVGYWHLGQLCVPPSRVKQSFLLDFVAL